MTIKTFNKNKLIVFAILISLFALLFLSSISAYANSQVQFSRPGVNSFNYNYGTQAELFPKFNEGMCESSQDFIIQIAPFGCTPAVVRSDLLEEQNVPVFCQLAATKLNPLIDVEAIDSITFSGQYPQEVSGIGFHPANAAVKGTQRQLLNSPVLENIGYAVIVLKQQENEKAMPDYVYGNLSAKIRYDVKNAFGIGETTFYLPVISNEEWKQNYKRYGFWNGKGYLRAEGTDINGATIAVYSDENRRLSSVFLEEGEISDLIYLPGFYCTASLKVRLDRLENPDTRAKLDINGQVTEIIEGENFLENRCRVNNIEKQGIVEIVNGVCRTDEGVDDFNLRIAPKIILEFNGEEKEFALGDFIGIGYTENPIVIGQLEKRNLYLGYAGTVEHSGNLEDLFVRIVAIPQGYSSEIKLTESQLSEAARYDSYQELSETGSVAEKYVGGAFTAFTAASERILKRLAAGSKISDRINIGKAGEEDFSGNIKVIGFAGVFDKEGGPDFKDYFDKAIEDYRRVAGSFGGEKTQDNDQITFGERALSDAIKLSSSTYQKKTLNELCEEFKSKYPRSSLDNEIIQECDNAVQNANQEVSTQSFLINGRVSELSFKGIYEPSYDEFGAGVIISGTKNMEYDGFTAIRKNDIVYLSESEYIILRDVQEDYAVFAIETQDPLYREFAWDTTNIRINKGEIKILGTNNYRIQLDEINLKKQARVSLIPEIKKVGSTANFTFSVGIEKRAIQLSPGQTKDRIEKLNRIIKQWEDISNNLGNVVRGMKTACIGAGALITFKNFFGNLDGESIARREVMRSEGGWMDICKEKYSKGEYYSVNACLLENSDKIDSDVEALYGAMQSQGAITEENVGERAEEIKKELGILDPDVSAALSSDGYKEAKFTLTQLRDLERYQNIIDANPSEELKAIAEKKMAAIIKDIEVNSKSYLEFSSLQSELRGAGLDLGVNSYGKIESIEGTYSGGTLLGSQISGISGLEPNTNYPTEIVIFNNKKYVVILDGEGSDYFIGDNGNYIYEYGGTTAKGITLNSVSEPDKKSIGETFSKGFKKYVRSSYENPIKDYAKLDTLKYFETEPYKGMPAVIPFDVQKGWYVATRQTLPGFGNIRAYDESGAPASFQICNVGENGRIDFDRGYEDDTCRSFNPGTGQIYGTFPALDEGETANLVSKATNSIQQAQQQYKSGVKSVTINSVALKVGSPAVNIPDIQCQDVMSPDDCYLLFNLCDPVICPPSRCNLGGAFPVSDVIQSGIVGSIALCLPNVQEGIFIPVCLTGVQAGVDGLLSVFKNYKDCLQESLDTGQQTGICDEIHSIYLCEFFWRQAQPFSKIIIPKMFEFLTGQSGRGGGEYLAVQDAYQTAEDSFNYMVNYYGVNSLEAFKVRATQEVGTAVCRSFISARYPVSAEFFENLIEPDSPSQYNAWFSEIPFTTATVPPVSQYKIFYHIFAGKDRGAYYSVYLRAPAGISYYQVNPTFTVASGFIPRGDYASETREFTSPSGYQELCVNVNGREECGFKQVSTSFALDYTKDLYAAQQAEQTDINSEAGCVSGTPSAYSLLTPNLQEAGEEIINPELYNRGIVRVCSTDNPGFGTDVKAGTKDARWVSVGTCDGGRGKLKCWLDTQSVSSVIQSKDIEKDVLETTSQQYLDSLLLEAGDRVVSDEEVKKISELTDSQQIIQIINEDLLERVFWSNQKAQLLLKRAGAFGDLANKNIVSVGEIKRGFLKEDEILSFNVGYNSHIVELEEIIYSDIDGDKAVLIFDNTQRETFESEQEKEINLQGDKIRFKLISIPHPLFPGDNKIEYQIISELPAGVKGAIPREDPREMILESLNRLKGSARGGIQDYDNNGINCWDSVMYVYREAGVKFKCTYSDTGGKQYNLESGEELFIEEAGEGATFACVPFETASKKCDYVWNIENAEGIEINSEDSKLDLLSPGDIIHYVYNSQSPHNAIFVEWVDGNKGIARLFDWNQICPDGNSGCFGFYEEDISDDSHPVYLINSPYTTLTAVPKTPEELKEQLKEFGFKEEEISAIMQVKRCEDCGQGALNLCGRDECILIGRRLGVTCEYSPTQFGLRGACVRAEKERVDSEKLYRQYHDESRFVQLTEDITTKIISYSEAYYVPPALSMAVAAQESSFNSCALGDNNQALGLYQIHRAGVFEECKDKFFDGKEFSEVIKGFDNKENCYENEIIECGIWYLKEAYFGCGNDWKKALCKYNTGSCYEDCPYISRVIRYCGDNCF